MCRYMSSALAHLSVGVLGRDHSWFASLGTIPDLCRLSILLAMVLTQGLWRGYMRSGWWLCFLGSNQVDRWYAISLEGSQMDQSK